MSQEDIEATKAPLLDHLIELRSRLIKAVIAFGVMFAHGCLLTCSSIRSAFLSAAGTGSHSRFHREIRTSPSR